MDNICKGSSPSCNDSVSKTSNHHNADTVERQCLLKGILETDHENIALTKEITDVLHKLNLEAKTLPNNIKETLDKVVSIMKAEKILEFNEIAICVARERRKIEEKERLREERHMLQMHNKLYKSHERLLRRVNHLASAINSLENTIANDKNGDLHCNMMFLSAKLKEYQETEKKLENDLKDMGIEEFYPEKILEKHKLYLEQLSKLTDVNRSLTQYHDLPPNLTEAKLLLEHKRKELEELEQQISKKMND